MAVLKNRAKMSTSTTGTGTITLGSAESGYQTFADAGVANADVVRYVIEDGNNWEIGTGTYTATGTTLSRTVSESSNSDAAINLSGSATVFIGATAEDIQNFVASTGTATAPNDGVSIAIGGQAVASGTNSISLQRANSSGLDSIAAVVGNTTSSYGAQGTGAISIGTLSKATATAGTAVGYAATSTHSAASAFGTLATTTASNQIALGGSGITARISGAYNLPTSDGTNGQVLTTDGSGAVTFADAGGSIGGNTGVEFDDNVKVKFGSSGGNELEIYTDGTSSYITESGSSHLNIQGQEIKFKNASGTSLMTLSASQMEVFHSGSKKLETYSGGIQTTGTVNVNNAYTLPTADGTNGQVLTTDGSGAVTFADAGGGGGGADLYIANPVSATDPTAAGDNAVGIGDGADATGNDSISIGTGTIAGLESVAIGYNAASGTTTGSRNTSIGRSAAIYLTTGSNNTAVGRSALQGSNLDKVTGSGNAAIGYGAGSKNAGGNNNTYLGTDAGNAITSGSSNTFIGHNADGAATTSQQTALGYQAQTAGTEAIAIGNSKASGIGTFAAQIGTNSSSYGAIGNSGTAIGGLTKTTGLDFVFGRSSIASGGSGSLSLGMDNTSSGAGAVTLGKDNTASHTDAVVIGQGASSSAADQITLGHTDQTVRISSAYTLPTSDGTNGQVLTTDGSGAVTFATASGGGGASAQTIDIKTADYTVVSGDLGKIIKYFGAGADRTVTLTAGATLGEGFHVTILNANSGADERVVIDANSTETFGWANGPQTITLSRGELVRIIWDNTGGRWIIGEGGFNLSMRSDINPATTTAAGDGANGAIALGHNSLATGSQAVSLGRSLASNSYAFAAIIADNTSSYGASGSGSAAIMNYAKASSSNSGAFGFGANATNSMAYAFGAQTFATGNSSVSLGRNSLASATYSICIGNAGQNNIQSSIKFSGSQHANQGDAQIGLYPLMADTTDATATAMVTNHQSTPAAGTANQIVLPNNSAYAFHGTIVARQKAGDGTACAAWKIEGLIRREGSAGTTVLVNSATTVLDNTPNWGMALSADTTNGGLKVQVTGAASTNIRWTTSITTSELTFA